MALRREGKLACTREVGGRGWKWCGSLRLAVNAGNGGGRYRGGIIVVMVVALEGVGCRCKGYTHVVVTVF